MSEANIQRQIDKSWTLFLDRDGVINEEQVGSYITNWGEFVFCDGSLNAISNLSELFGRVVIVTNQRGVGKGIMTLDDLKDIHSRMSSAIVDAGGNIDRVYACTALEDNDHNRKPNTGMAVQAREDFSEIDFEKSVMVGNNLSDMQFGKKMGMHTVFLTTTQPPVSLPHDLVDEQFDTLSAWTSTLAAEVIG